MKRILFVDDEPRVLDGLRRMLYPMRQKWDMVFVNSGKAALELLANGGFDLLITDMRMPEMNGVDLLGKVLERHPEVMRVILSGTADQELTLHSVNVAHQYLDKPCDAATLRATIERAFNFRLMLDQPVLKDLVSRIGRLPSMPAAYIRLVQTLREPEVSLKEIGDIVASDVAMTAKILQLVNSAFFGLRRHFVDPTDAVIYLGVETVRALALTVAAFSQFEGLGRFPLDTLHLHSIRVGTLSRRIATKLQLSKATSDDCYVGGLLHDVGKLVLAANSQEKYDTAMVLSFERGLSRYEAECQVFGASHAQVGGYLLWLWGLPDAVSDVVLRHHGPSDEWPGPASSAAIVQLANALINEVPDRDLDSDALNAAGLLDDLDEWRELAQELLAREVSNVE